MYVYLWCFLEHGTFIRVIWGMFNCVSRLFQVFNRDEPDHEKELRVIVKANDKGVPSLEGTCAFVVNVLDVNDNAPMFDKSVSPRRVLTGATVSGRLGDRRVRCRRGMQADSCIDPELMSSPLQRRPDDAAPRRNPRILFADWVCLGHCSPKL